MDRSLDRRDRPTILAVDDDSSVLEALHLILDERYGVIEARNGEAAISLALAQEPDLILLDLLLVGMDGFSVLEELRHRRVKAPVVVISGLNAACTAATALRGGAADYVTKPFDEDLLLHTIDSTLTRANRSACGPVVEAAAAPRVLLIGAAIGVASALIVALSRQTRLSSVRNSTEALRSLRSDKTDVVVIDAWTRPADAARLLEQPALKSFAARVLVVAGAGEHGLEVQRRWWTLMPGPLRTLPLLDHIAALLADHPRQAPPLSPAVATAIDYVGGNVPSVHVRDLGQAAAKSPDYLSRLFQRETGLALKGFINRVRAEAGRVLLLTTDEKVDAIAAEVGLRDASHLSRLCVKYLGCRPGELRSARPSS
jgi:DNA-binding NtrC family response regulator